MSQPAESAAPVAAACPITADFLPPNLRKHVDPKKLIVITAGDFRGQDEPAGQ